MRGSLKSAAAALLACAPPLLTLLLLRHFASPPAHSFLYPDPDFGYLFNSLMILDGRTPWHVDHPGTPIQLLGALWMKLHFAFHGSAPTLAEDFFLRPLAYHQFVLHALLALFLLAQWCSGLLLQRFSILYSLAIPLLPLTYFDWIDYADHISPESLMAGISLCLVPAALAASPLALGLLLGLLCSFKATALPLLLLLFLLPSRRERLLGLGSAALFYLFVTAPIWSEYPRMLSWYLSLGAHSGAYGQGANAFPSSPQLLSRLEWLLSGGQWHGVLPALFFFPLLLLWPSQGLARWPIALAAALHFALVLKHPATRYILPFLPLSAIALMRTGRAPWISQIALSALLLAPAPFLIRQPLDGMAGWRRQEGAAIAALEGRLKEKYENCQITIVNEIGHPAFALFAGNFATGINGYGEPLNRLFPRYNFLFAQLRNFDRVATPAEWKAFLKLGTCHLLVGRPERAEATIESLLGQKPELLELVGSARNYGIYKIPNPALAKIPELPPFLPAETPYSLQKLKN